MTILQRDPQSQLISIFENTVNSYAHKTAIICDDITLTYDELDKKANQLAHYFLACQIKQNDIIGVLLPRSIECYISLLAILKIGAIYVPISEEYPAERIKHILSDMDFAAVLTTSTLKKSAENDTTKTIIIQNVASEISQYSDLRVSSPKSTLQNNPTCYVIYTSGSTGKPNGVAVGHHSICHYVNVASSTYGMTEHDLVYHGFSLAFDASLEEIWMAFANGATLVVATSKEIRSGLGLIDFLNRYQITVFSTVPTLLENIKGSVDSLRLLILGGEVCTAKILEPWYRKDLKIMNTYGPTEATIVTTFFEYVKDEPMTIGKPLPGYEILILNEEGHPVLRGETGELCIAGIALAQGYVNREELTAAKFIQNPLDPSSRIYRTGDLVHWDDHNNLVYIGRLDDQVKLRGFRLELHEIEEQFMMYPGIKHCVVTLVQQDEPKLVAYFTTQANQTIEIQALKHFLSERLPAFMLPSIYEPLESFPLLSSGKVNRKHLPLPKSKPDANLYLPPTTDLEIKAANIVAKILKRSQISIRDDFFSDLGMHSLTAALMISEFRKIQEFHHLSMLDLYHYKTIENVSKAFDIPQPIPKTSTKKQRVFQQTSRWRHSFCALGQAFGIVLQYALSSWQIFAFFIAFTWGAKQYPLLSLPSLGIFLGLVIALPLISLSIVIMAKWILLGRVKPGKHRLWGWFYFRWWLTSRLEALLFPINSFVNTPMTVLYYRLMGAKIGKQTYIDTPYFAMYDLISIGDHTSINHNAVLKAYSIEDGYIHLGTISIGSDCYVGIRSVLDLDTRMEDHACLDDLSLLPKHKSILSHQFYSGSPSKERPCPKDHITRQFPQRSQQLASGGGWKSFLQCCAVFFVEFLYIGCYLPSIFLLIEITETRSLHAAILFTPLAALIQLCFFCIVILTVKSFCPRIKSGQYHVDSLGCLCQWVIAQLLEKNEIQVMADSLYFPRFFRLLGAKLGSNVEIAEINDPVPDLIMVHDNGTVASDVSLAPAKVYHDVVLFDRAIIGKNSFVGNASVLSQGSYLYDGGILGCLSIMPSKEQTMVSQATWLGSPSILLPSRERSADGSQQEAAKPTLKMRGFRWGVELCRILIPSTLTIANITLLHAFFEYYLSQNALLKSFIYFPFLETGIMFGFATLFVLFKWILVGKYISGAFPLWDPFIRKKDIVEFTFWYFFESAFTNMLLGTPFLPMFLRRLGAKIGKNTYIETTLFEEFDLIDIGDEVVINSNSGIQTHLYEDRIFKMSNITIGSYCNIAHNSIVLYDTHMEPYSKLGSLSLLMKGETLPEGSAWEGSPAQALEE